MASTSCRPDTSCYIRLGWRGAVTAQCLLHGPRCAPGSGNESFCPYKHGGQSSLAYPFSCAHYNACYSLIQGVFSAVYPDQNVDLFKGCSVSCQALVQPGTTMIDW